ncbi:poly-beta-1,6-N-acetyl-D-glucosamine biosynthesis protein PgaD [Leclercia sp. J807]|uniref:poly-beta-1,6-N-acetyl-D-glucosamine biosynthesis protein PgaD n=1 Tax=Leclercia sp. J807 TaxID=2681307 RepID=UPI0012E168A9|nr:poly-beta-1,6-N-acetyl-D-glucosamine biosynthesis protein PgaD [Leclercia sp. J807]QGU11027.1 poly-beta-1,6-N-acetyl-D-glucosamine biosynthesis protein PgaD [Leclercia sp. J807]
MIQPLIFTEQRLFPRMLDCLLTIVAWLGFSWLIYRGLITAIEHDPFIGTRPFYITLSTLSLYLLVACLIGLALITWAKYNQLRFRVERRKRRPGLERHEVAASFNITPELALMMNQAQVFTLAHYDTGAIDRVWMAKILADVRSE